jgi:hypothetical protein
VKYTVEMGAGAMSYIASFIKIGSCIRKFIGTAWRSHKPTSILFQKKESRITKIKVLPYGRH